MKYKLKLDDKQQPVLKDGNPVWVDEAGSDVDLDVNDLFENLQAVTAESTKRKATIRKMEEKLASFKDIDDPETFLSEAKQARETLESLKAKDIEKAENIKKMKDEWTKDSIAREAKLKDEHEKTLAALNAQIERKRKQLRQLLISNRFATSELFGGTSPKTQMTADAAERLFGEYFLVEEDEDGKLPRIAAYWGEDRPIETMPGRPADFDQALRIIWDKYPHKDNYSRAAPPGGGSTGGAGGPMRRGDDLESVEQALKDAVAARDAMAVITLQTRAHELRMQRAGKT